MPRPNHPTDVEYDNALDKADFYRRKWLEIEAERDALLAALEALVAVAAPHPDSPARPTLSAITAAYVVINKTRGVK